MKREKYKALDFVNNHYIVDTYYYERDDGAVDVQEEKRRSILSKHFTNKDIIHINKPTIDELLEFKLNERSMDEIFEYLDIEFNKQKAYNIVLEWSMTDNMEFALLLNSYLLNRTINKK